MTFKVLQKMLAKNASSSFVNQKRLRLDLQPESSVHSWKRQVSEIRWL
jgi:hypothetical protein